MNTRRLGTSDLHVSELCLGTMTWGEQNTIEDAHSQLDYAVAHGINYDSLWENGIVSVEFNK